MADNGIRTKQNESDTTDPKLVTRTDVAGGKSAVDTYVNNPITDAVNVIDPQLAASLGVTPGITRITIDGHGLVIGTTETTLWPLDTIYPFPSSASVMTISSTDAEDNAAGTGAHLIRVEGLDASYVQQSEFIVPTGLTGISTANSYLRINKVTVVQTGSGNVNAGDIYIGTGTITSGIPASIVNLVEFGGCVSRSCFFTIPADHVLVVVSTNVNPTLQKNFTTRLYTHLVDGTIIRGSEAHTTSSSPFGLPYPSPPIAEKIDVELRGFTDSGTIEGDVSLGCLLVSTTQGIGVSCVMENVGIQGSV